MRPWRSLREPVSPPVRATTDSDGRFRFTIERSELAPDGSRRRFPGPLLAAFADGYGPVWTDELMIGDVRGQGLMIGLELVRDRKTREPAPAEAKAARAALRERGVLVGVGGVFGNVVRLQPPLSITSDECERAMDELEKVM